VLGTTHLSGVADQFEPAAVDSLITLRRVWARCNRRGEPLRAADRGHGTVGRPLQRGPDRFAEPSLHHGNRIREQAGWTWSEANRRADSLLALARSDTMELGAEDRLTLIHNLMGAYRLPTAVLQWRHLPPQARSTQSRLPDTTVADLNERLTAANETYAIRMRLAHRRGHQRLYPIDDQTEKDLAAEAGRTLMKAIGDSMRKAFDTHPVFSRADSLKKAGLEDGNLLPYYRYVNQEKVGRANVNLQWRTMLEVDLPNDVGRQWLAL